MNLATFITERFAGITTIALHIFFLYRTLETKVDIRRQIIAGGVFALVMTLLFLLEIDNRAYFSVVIGIIYAAYVFAGGFKSYLVWSIILVCLDGIVDAAIISLYLLSPETVATQIDQPGIVRILFVISAKITLFAVYYFITKRIDKSHAVQWQDCVPLLIVPVGCWIILEVVFQYIDTVEKGMVEPLLTLSGVVLLLIMVSVISLYNRISADSRELAQSKLQINTTKLTQEHINQINDLYARLSTVRHDLQSHFAAMSGYIKAKDYSGLEQYLHDIADVSIGEHEYSKHPVLNALISSKASMAKSKGIDFSAKIELPDSLPISDVDLCILVSNILDNAFEANEKVKNQRYIYLHTRIVNPYWVVACRNATCMQRRFRATGSMQSTKEDIGAHGIGTKQIQRIAESSGGFVTYRHDNFEFAALAMVKMP